MIFMVIVLFILDPVLCFLCVCWKQVKRSIKSCRRNGRTDNCLKIVKIFLRWRVNTIAIQYALILEAFDTIRIFNFFLKSYLIFKYFREKQFLPYGGYATMFGSSCRITTAYLDLILSNIFDRQKKRINWFGLENGHSSIL